MLITVWMISTASLFLAPSLVGTRLFRALAEMGYWGCLFAGVLLTADSLSEEKRDGTLGLLFLTDLKGHDVVLGKLAATSLNACYGLLAVFPALVVPAMLGGVTGGEVARLMAALLNTLFFSLAVGLVVSALARQEHAAVLWTATLVLFVGCVLPLLGETSRLLSPRAAFALGFDAAFRLNPAGYFASLAFVQLLGWALLALAGARVSRWTEEPVIGAKARAQSEEARAPIAARAAGEINPIEWLARRRERHGWVWASLILVVAIGIAWSQPPGAVRARGELVIFAVVCWHSVLKFWIAWEAGRRFAEDRRNGALELLLVTPLRVEEIVRGQFRSLRRLFAGPVAALLVVDAFVALGVFRATAASPLGDEALGCLLVFALMLPVDAYALGRVGLWLGFKHQRTWRAALAAVMRIMVVPGVAFALVTLGGGGGSFAAMILTWLMIGGICAVGFGALAQANLLTQFRELASAWMTDQPPPPALPGDWSEDYAPLQPRRATGG
jgi:ABC-type transport system involved in multi-copper enzyme maturation permease subunit